MPILSGPLLRFNPVTLPSQPILDLVAGVRLSIRVPARKEDIFAIARLSANRCGLRVDLAHSRVVCAIFPSTVEVAGLRLRAGQAVG